MSKWVATYDDYKHSSGIRPFGAKTPKQVGQRPTTIANIRLVSALLEPKPQSEWVKDLRRFQMLPWYPSRQLQNPKASKQKTYANPKISPRYLLIHPQPRKNKRIDTFKT